MGDGSEGSSRYDVKGNMAQDHGLPEREPGSTYRPRMPLTFNETETKGVTSRSSIPDWLEQENSEAAGKGLISMQRPLGRPGRVTEPHGPFERENHPAPGSPTLHTKALVLPEHPTRPVSPGHIANLYASYGQQHASSSLPGSRIPTPPDPFSPRRNTALNRIQEPPESKSAISFDVLHDPSEPAKDVIFKLSLPIKEDFEPILEEFCRLRRLGRFKDAKELFGSKLEHLGAVPYVLVQYGEMLLASGDYKSFRSLQHWEKYPSSESEDEETIKDPCLDKLEGNFWLLDFLAKVPHSQPTPEGDIFQAITNIVGKLSFEPDMGSTEVRWIDLDIIPN